MTDNHHEREQVSLRKFDLSLLPALDALLRERNVTRAAGRLFVSQQALSATLHRLRIFFDDVLLVRVGRGYDLTPLAQSLVQPVREALLAAEAVLVAKPSFDPATARDTFKVVMSDYASMVLLPGVLRRLERAAPNLVLHVTTVTGDGLRRLALGELDLCLASSDIALFDMAYPDGTLRSRPLFEDDFVVVFDPLSTTLPIPFDLADYRGLRHGIAMFEDGVSTIVQRGWSQDGGRFRVALSAPGFSNLMYMLPGTSIVATVQRRLAAVMAPALGLAVAGCPIPLPPLRQALYWPNRLEGQPAHAYLRAAFIDASCDLADVVHKDRL